MIDIQGSKAYPAPVLVIQQSAKAWDQVMRSSAMLSFLALTSLFNSGLSFAEGELPTFAKKSVAIEDKYGVSLTATAHLGALPKATRGVIVITLTNDTAEEIRIDRVKASCACLSPSVTAKSIDSGGAADLVFILETPGQAVRKEISVGATLISPDGRDVRLSMRYVIEGVLAVDSPVSVVEVKNDDELQRFEIPITYTAPIDPSQIEVVADKQLEPIVFSVVQQDQRAALVGEFPLDAIEKGGLSGRVTISHAGAGQECPIEIIVRRASPVTLSPSIITMRREDDERQFIGSAILRVRETENQSTAASNAALIDGSVEGIRVTVAANRLGKGIYRVKISCEPPEEWLREVRHKSADMKVQVRCLGKMFESSNALRFIE